MTNQKGFLAAFAVFSAALLAAISTLAADGGKPSDAGMSELEHYRILLASPDRTRRQLAVEMIAALADSAHDSAAAVASLEAAATRGDEAAAQARFALERRKKRQAESVPAGAWPRSAGGPAGERGSVDECADKLGGDRIDRLEAVEVLAALLDSSPDSGPLLALLRFAAGDRDLEVSAQAAHALGRYEGRRAGRQTPVEGSFSPVPSKRSERSEWEEIEWGHARARLTKADRLALVETLSARLDGAVDRVAAARLLEQAVLDPEPSVAAQAAYALERARARGLLGM